MTLKQLQQGLKIYNDLKEKKDKLKQIQDYLTNNTTLSLNVAGIDIPVSKPFINTKIQTRIADLQAEIDTLQAQFDNL